jgi:23S rRNA (pseudouridine1915-N3)-methyltransferase
MPKTPIISIELLCISKLKGRANQYIADGLAEFQKRLTPYCKFTITELPDEKQSAGTSDEQVKQAEGERLLKALQQRADYVVVMTEHAKAVDSPRFAEQLIERHPGLNTQSYGKQRKGGAHMVVVIGGALGLDPRVLAAADWQLSLSPMTFPHMLVRLLFIEQLYRAFRILNGEPYHK